MHEVPGMTNTGLKRGRAVLWHFDPDIAAVMGEKAAKARKKGLAGQTDMGKKSKHAN